VAPKTKLDHKAKKEVSAKKDDEKGVGATITPEKLEGSRAISRNEETTTQKAAPSLLLTVYHPDDKVRQ